MTTDRDIYSWLETRSSYMRLSWDNANRAELDNANRAELDQALALADKCIEDLREALPRVSLTAYWTTSGPRIVLRYKLRLPGLKRPAVVSNPSKDPDAEDCVRCAWAATRDEDFSCGVLYVMRAYAVDMAVAEFGSELRAKMDAAKPAVDPTRDRAHRQLARNLQSAEAKRRQAAMKRLSHEMLSYEYTEQDVLEAWRMSQVERVNES